MNAMKNLIDCFPDQLRKAISIGEKAKLTISDKEIQNVFIIGLGGSGIGGKIVSQFVQDHCPVPVVTNNNYDSASFISENTLVIACSYSGNTEETLIALNQCVVKNAEVAGVTSGGELKYICEKNNYNHIVIPGGFPPRSCIGYSIVQLLYILKAYKLTNIDVASEIQNSIKLIEDEAENIHKESEILAKKCKDKTPVIYSEANYEGIAVRLRQQINENAKQLCWHHVLPEMNHNELVGWAGGKSEFEVLIFRNEDDHSRTKVRIEICKEIISKYANISEVVSKGNTRIERSFYLINLGDWLSYYLSIENNVDPVEVKVIDHLKGELSKI